MPPTIILRTILRTSVTALCCAALLASGPAAFAKSGNGQGQGAGNSPGQTQSHEAPGQAKKAGEHEADEAVDGPRAAPAAAKQPRGGARNSQAPAPSPEARGQAPGDEAPGQAKKDEAPDQAKAAAAGQAPRDAAPGQAKKADAPAQAGGAAASARAAQPHGQAVGQAVGRAGGAGKRAATPAGKPSAKGPAAVTGVQGHGPSGNAGSIKVNPVDWTASGENAPRNHPHVGCTFDVNFYGSYADVDEVSFVAHPPSGRFVDLAVRPQAVWQHDVSPPGGTTLVETQRWDLGDALSSDPEIVEHHKQGYHVKVTAESDRVGPGNRKHKVFWVRCDDGQGGPQVGPQGGPQGGPQSGGQGDGNTGADKGNGGGAEVTATFTCPAVTVGSSKDLSNVVLVFADGSTQRFEGLSGTTGTFTGTGANAGKAVTDVYVKSGSNFSGDGPGYGEHFSNRAGCVTASAAPALVVAAPDQPSVTDVAPPAPALLGPVVPGPSQRVLAPLSPLTPEAEDGGLSVLPETITPPGALVPAPAGVANPGPEGRMVVAGAPVGSVPTALAATGTGALAQLLAALLLLGGGLLLLRRYAR